MSTLRAISPVLLGCILSGAAIATDLLQPAAPAEKAESQVPRSKPVNLKVLPADIAPAHLGKMMKRFEKDLGVSCSYCHVENRDTAKLDYISDDNPRKQTARLMMTMLDDINGKYLAQLETDRRYAVPVTCGSCHLGRANPQAYEPRWQ